MKKKNNQPSRKRLKRSVRLKVAKDWILDFTGKGIVSRYSKCFAVDLICAIVELRMNGVEISETYEKQVKKSIKEKSEKRKLRRENERKDFADTDSDDRFAYIAGYTSGGAPYGITHEEMMFFTDDE